MIAKSYLIWFVMLLAKCCLKFYIILRDFEAQPSSHAIVRVVFKWWLEDCILKACKNGEIQQHFAYKITNQIKCDIIQMFISKTNLWFCSWYCLKSWKQREIESTLDVTSFNFNQCFLNCEWKSDVVNFSQLLNFC